MTAATATRTEKLEVSTAHFERSHGRQARGRGSWAFQKTEAREAFERHLSGEVLFFQGTFGEAKRQLRESGASGLWAALA